MRTIVLYDSLYGNTERVAQAIGTAVGAESSVLSVRNADLSDLRSFDLVIVGAPTQGGRASEAMREFLSRVPSLDGVRVAAFDTRLRARWVKVFGFAAGTIAESMRALGATSAAEPEGFFVEGKKGPLAGGELERAADWAKSL